MNKKIILTVTIIVAVLLSAAGLIWRFSGKTGQTQIASESSPVKGSITISIAATGVVEPQNRLEINPPISGRVEDIRVKEGMVVKKGQILALMSSTERAALLDAARLQSPEELEYWKTAYQATAIVAPIDGKIIVRDVEPGQTVTSSDAIFVISDRLMVRADVDETDIGSIQIGQSAVIHLDAYPDVKAEGTVDHISFESVEVNNVTVYYVEIIMEKTPDVFRSGMSANIEIIRSQKNDIIKIPQSLVHHTERGDMVLVRADNEKGFTRCPVVLGLADDTDVEVVEGLTLQDRIVTLSDSSKSKSKRSKQKESSSPFMPNFKGKRR